MPEDAAPAGAIQIVEPLVFEIQTPTIPLLPTVSTPPGVGLSSPIHINYVCPLSIHCGTDDPCSFTHTLPLSISLPIPVFTFPPEFNFPVFGFRFEIPPPIFLKCPAFKEEDAVAQAAKDVEPEPDEDEVRVDPPPADGTSLNTLNPEILEALKGLNI